MAPLRGVKDSGYGKFGGTAGIERSPSNAGSRSSTAAAPPTHSREDPRSARRVDALHDVVGVLVFQRHGAYTPPAACHADAAWAFSSRGRSFSARSRTFSFRSSAASRSRLACSARGRASFSRTSASASASTPAGTATKHCRYGTKRITHHTRRLALRREIPGCLPFISSLRSPAQLPLGAEMVPVSWKLNVP